MVWGYDYYVINRMKGMIQMTTPTEAAAKIAQAAWNTHYMIACSDDADICSWNTPTYIASQRLLLATLRQVYGLTKLKAQRVYDVLIDSGESVAYSVAYVKANRHSTAYSR